MSALGDLLELMHTAAQRQSGITGTYRAWRQERLTGRLEDESDIWFGEDFVNRRTSPGEVEVSTRFWVDPPSRARLERRDPDGNLGLLVAVDGARRGVFTAGWGAELEDHHVGDMEWVLGPLARMLDPGALPGSLELNAPEAAEVAGREALVTKAEIRDEYEPPPWPFGPAEGYELWVDRERGMLLKLIGFVSGKEALVHELTEIELEPGLDEETFLFDPPAPQEVSGLGLRDAARLASFSPWALPIPVIDVTYRAEFAPTRSPESLTLSYSDVTLLEMPRAAPYSFTSYGEPSRIDRSGRTYWALPGSLMFHVDETFVVMTASPDVPTDELVNWAETLTKLD
jgi:hypothetical protein